MQKSQIEGKLKFELGRRRILFHLKSISPRQTRLKWWNDVGCNDQHRRTSNSWSWSVHCLLIVVVAESKESNNVPAAACLKLSTHRLCSCVYFVNFGLWNQPLNFVYFSRVDSDSIQFCFVCVVNERMEKFQIIYYTLRCWCWFVAEMGLTVASKVEWELILLGLLGVGFKGS